MLACSASAHAVHKWLAAASEPAPFLLLPTIAIWPAPALLDSADIIDPSMRGNRIKSPPDRFLACMHHNHSTHDSAMQASTPDAVVRPMQPINAAMVHIATHQAHRCAFHRSLMHLAPHAVGSYSSSHASGGTHDTQRTRALPGGERVGEQDAARVCASRSCCHPRSIARAIVALGATARCTCVARSTPPATHGHKQCFGSTVCIACAWDARQELDVATLGTW